MFTRDEETLLAILRVLRSTACAHCGNTPGRGRVGCVHCHGARASVAEHADLLARADYSAVVAQAAALDNEADQRALARAQARAQAAGWELLLAAEATLPILVSALRELGAMEPQLHALRALRAAITRARIPVPPAPEAPINLPF